MPGNTTRRNYPFGVLSDTLPDLLDVSELAQAIDDDLFAALTGAFAAHICVAYRAPADGNTSSVTDSTWSTIGFPSELADTDGYHSISSQTARMTVPTGLAGFYLFGYNARFVGNATGGRDSYMDINADGARRASQSASTVSSGVAIMSAIGLEYLNDGDYLQVNFWQSSGGGLAVAQDGHTPNMWMVRLPFFS
jgi:hypothetical protein